MLNREDGMSDELEVLEARRRQLYGELEQLGDFRPGTIPDTLSTAIVVDVLSSSHSGVEFSFNFADRLCVSVWRFFLVGTSSFWADSRPMLDLRV